MMSRGVAKKYLKVIKGEGRSKISQNVTKSDRAEKEEKLRVPPRDEEEGGVNQGNDDICLGPNFFTHQSTLNSKTPDITIQDSRHHKKLHF